jgi:DnaJ-class molecular chaperone
MQPNDEVRGQTNPGDEAPPDVTGAGEDLCRTCQGTGKVEGTQCEVCGGTGKVQQGIGGG